MEIIKPKKNQAGETIVPEDDENMQLSAEVCKSLDLLPPDPNEPKITLRFDGTPAAVTSSGVEQGYMIPLTSKEAGLPYLQYIKAGISGTGPLWTLIGSGSTIDTLPPSVVPLLGLDLKTAKRPWRIRMADDAIAMTNKFALVNVDTGPLSFPLRMWVLGGPSSHCILLGQNWIRRTHTEQSWKDLTLILSDRDGRECQLALTDSPFDAAPAIFRRGGGPSPTRTKIILKGKETTVIPKGTRIKVTNTPGRQKKIDGGRQKGSPR